MQIVSSSIAVFNGILIIVVLYVEETAVFGKLKKSSHLLASSEQFLHLNGSFLQSQTIS